VLKIEPTGRIDHDTTSSSGMRPDSDRVDAFQGNRNLD
jgi:hypothetical protein